MEKLLSTLGKPPQNPAPLTFPSHYFLSSPGLLADRRLAHLLLLAREPHHHLCGARQFPPSVGHEAELIAREVPQEDITGFLLHDLGVGLLGHEGLQPVSLGQRRDFPQQFVEHIQVGRGGAGCQPS